jgi:hypothetical protein
MSATPPAKVDSSSADPHEQPPNLLVPVGLHPRHPLTTVDVDGKATQPPVHNLEFFIFEFITSYALVDDRLVWFTEHLEKHTSEHSWFTHDDWAEIEICYERARDAIPELLQRFCHSESIKIALTNMLSNLETRFDRVKREFHNKIG